MSWKGRGVSCHVTPSTLPSAKEVTRVRQVFELVSIIVLGAGCIPMELVRAESVSVTSTVYAYQALCILGSAFP